MDTDSFRFIPPDNVDTVALCLDVKPISDNILDEQRKNQEFIFQN